MRLPLPSQFCLLCFKELFYVGLYFIYLVTINFNKYLKGNSIKYYSSRAGSAFPSQSIFCT